jgi:putative inorganic carbon (hco3(-)) transporter
MRSLALIATLLATMPLAIFEPHLGILVWAWLSFMSPHQLVYIPLPVPLVYVVSVATAIGWLVSREPKRLPPNTAMFLLLLFMAWVTISTALSLEPSYSWFAWNRNIKNMILALAVMGLMTNRVRLHALVWVIVLSLGYYGLKGGIFVLVTGGGSQVIGQNGSMIADNNQMGLALVMTWPFIYYLWLHSENKFVKLGLIGVMGATLLAIFGTYSRGAFLGIMIVLGYFWWKAKRKIAIAVVGALVLVPAIAFLPERWSDRMHTITTYDQDSSALSRFESWQLAFRMAVDHPIFGDGFEAIVSPRVTAPYVTRRVALEAHSIWFQVLSDQGFVGLGIFIALGLFGYRNATIVRRLTRDRPDLAWARDLATMGQLSLAGFWAAGTFLSMAYYDVYYTVIAILTVECEIVPKLLTQASAAEQGLLSDTPMPAVTAPVASSRS